jgi:hypothetical protein
MVEGFNFVHGLGHEVLETYFEDAELSVDSRVDFCFGEGFEELGDEGAALDVSVYYFVDGLL